MIIGYDKQEIEYVLTLLNSVNIKGIDSIANFSKACNILQTQGKEVKEEQEE